jgi:hypothetical protein
MGVPSATLGAWRLSSTVFLPANMASTNEDRMEISTALREGSLGNWCCGITGSFFINLIK